MNSIYHFTDYREYFKDWLKQQPKSGRGEPRRLAAHLGVSTTMVSQIFSGSKELSMEMAMEMSQFLNLNDDECEYFILLVEYSRSGSHKLKSFLNKQIKDRQEKAKKLANRLKKMESIDEQTKNIYYSNWVYPVLRLIVDIPEFSNPEAISKKLSIPLSAVRRSLDFLIKNNLVILNDGKFKIGPAHIYLSASDPNALKNHQNFRLLSSNKMLNGSDDDFYYTGLYVLSDELAKTLRAELPDFIESIIKKVRPSKSETFRCLNLDFFEI